MADLSIDQNTESIQQEGHIVAVAGWRTRIGG